jgi:hypothetical protein
MPSDSVAPADETKLGVHSRVELLRLGPVDSTKRTAPPSAEKSVVKPKGDRREWMWTLRGKISFIPERRDAVSAWLRVVSLPRAAIGADFRLTRSGGQHG